MDIHELQAFLKSHNIPLELWGHGKAKTLEHLLFEINSGETILEEKDGKLLRCNEGSSLNVYHDDGTTLWLLHEEKQVFRDGRSRTRNLSTSIGEKIKSGENPVESAYRALSEELGITEKLLLISKPLEIKGPVASDSFPGLYSLYTINVFDVFLPKYLYKPEGYIEHQDDKSNYFVWKKFEDSKAHV